MLLRNCRIRDCGKPCHAKRLCAYHYWRQYNTGSPTTPQAQKQMLGRMGELYFYLECDAAGREIDQANHYHSKYDFTVDGQRIDVKTSSPNNHKDNWLWQFRLHSHGVRSPEVDAYVLRLHGIPNCLPLSLFVPASDVPAKALKVTLESLLHDATVRSWADAYRSFLAGRFAGKQVAA